MARREAWDLISVGGGIAGMAAAVRAAEHGMRVAVLERGTDEAYPCNTRYSGGIIHVAYCDAMREPDELVRIIRESTNNSAPLPLATAIAEGAGPLINWLQSLGIRFMRFSNVEFHRWCMAPPRTVNPGLDWKGRGPDVMLRTLKARLEALGGSVALGTRVKELRMSEGRCVGVVAEGMEGEEAWSAENVVISDGGFQANQPLFQQYISPSSSGVFQRGAATGTGDGLNMAANAGAAVVASPYFYGHVLSLDSFENDRVWPYPELDAIACAGLVVDRDGRRVLDEGLGGICVANELARLPDPTSCAAIFDSEVWDGPGKSARIPANPLLERANGTVLRADSIEALAEQLQMPSHALAATVAGHNAALQTGALDKLDPPRSSLVTAWPIRKPPFMAIRICPGITYTMGGIAIDEFAQALDNDGEPIPGLFAAGATTGGLEGRDRLGYVGGLVKSGVMGLRAADRIAELRLRV